MAPSRRGGAGYPLNRRRRGKGYAAQPIERAYDRAMRSARFASSEHVAQTSP
jgi:hypothetical protein